MLRWGRKREGSLRLHQTEMLLVPLIQSIWIIRSQKYSAEASDGSHAISYGKVCTEHEAAGCNLVKNVVSVPEGWDSIRWISRRESYVATSLDTSFKSAWAVKVDDAGF